MIQAMPKFDWIEHRRAQRDAYIEAACAIEMDDRAEWEARVGQVKPGVEYSFGGGGDDMSRYQRQERAEFEDREAWKRRCNE